MGKLLKSSEYIIIAGKNRILISAPHTYGHLRRNVEGVYRVSEEEIEDILKTICEAVKCFGIYSAKSLEYDPNYSGIEENEYKKEVEKIVKQRKITHFIDLHGLDPKSEYDFAIFHTRKYSRSSKFAREISEKIQKGLLKDSSIIHFNFADGDGETLSQFVSKRLKIPAIQIEIAKYIREDKRLSDSLIDNLSSFLITLS